MKLFIMSIVILLVWMFPIFLAYHVGNWWLLFVYLVWWIPASIITAIVATGIEALDEIWK